MDTGDRFKFRAYCERYNGLRYSDLQKVDYDCDMLRLAEFFDFIKINPADWTIMQSTGLKDISGTLVYEGDIVKWTSTHNVIGEAKEHVDAVVWDQDCICYMLMPWVHEPHCARMEIIGNIYESPELLRGL